MRGGIFGQPAAFRSVVLLIVAVLVSVAVAVAWHGLGLNAPLRQRLQSGFPHTRIEAIDCRIAVPGLCEVTAGTTLFYATRDGRYILVGSVLDLKKKVDLTDERLRQLAAMGAATAPLQPPASKPADPAPAEPPAKLKIDLPLANAIVHNPGGRLRLTVFSDFNCGYCRMLFTQATREKDIEITEFPIAVLGDDSLQKARLVLCARDRASAALAAYTKGPLAPDGDCAAAAAAVAANTRFATTHGIRATPTIIGADGTLSQGYLPPDALKAFGAHTS